MNVCSLVICPALLVAQFAAITYGTATTAAPCNPPPPMKYVIGLDASKSMTSQGWAAAVRFANGMIDYTLQDHAGKKSEVMLYYFNGLLVVWLSHVWLVRV